MNINKFLQQHPALIYAEDLREICKPLELLDIVYFSHAHIDAEQKFSGLGIVPEFFELYFKKGYFSYDIHMANPQLKEEYILWDCVERKKESQELHQDFMSFNQGHTFSIVMNNEESKDCFHFATRLGNDTMNQHYLQLIEQFKQFISYFKDKVANHKELAKAYNLKIQIQTKEGGYFTENNRLDLVNFSKHIQTQRTYIEGFDKYFTERELACLNCFAYGKTIDETAATLGITSRTVKAHIKTMKEKFGCDNQFQLGMYFSKLIK